MWTKRGGLWIWDDAERQAKVADRPHRITIVMGFLSPVLALVAVAISYGALKISDQSMKVANRAHIALSNGKMRFSYFGIVEDKKLSPVGFRVVRLDLSAVIQNAGNSPAVAGEFKRKYRLPKGWREAPADLKKRFAPDAVGTIGPRSTKNWFYTDLFDLDAESFDAFRNNPGQYFVDVDAEFDYKDAFGETRTVKWCWVAATNERRTLNTECEYSHQLLFVDPSPMK